jgi:hypothetical protein
LPSFFPSQQRKRSFPPKKLHDLGGRSAGHFLALLRDVTQAPVTVTLGSGASASVGLPVWSSLLERICITFFRHWDGQIRSNTASYDRPPRKLSIGGVGDFGPIDDLVRKMLNAWGEDVDEFAREYARNDPLLVAQQIKNCIKPLDWRYLLYKALYSRFEDQSISIPEISSQLLDKLALFCERHRFMAGVVNYNYDNTFKFHLKRRHVKFSILWDDKCTIKAGRLPIFYPHGYLPFPGGPITKTVLAETDYHEEAAEPYAWANLVQVRSFLTSVCIFVGTSMVDPNLRRLLRIAAGIKPRWHYAFMPREAQCTQKQIMSDALFDFDLSRLGVKVIRFPKRDTPDECYARLPELLDLLATGIQEENVIWQA